MAGLYDPKVMVQMTDIADATVAGLVYMTLMRCSWRAGVYDLECHSQRADMYDPGAIAQKAGCMIWVVMAGWSWLEGRLVVFH